MKTRSIMTKSQFMTRRKVILYIIATILILGIVSGFTNQFISDNTRKQNPYGQTFVTEQDWTEATGTPENYDLITNLRFAAYRINHATYFRAETRGETVADMGYTQHINNTRVAKRANGVDILFTKTVSVSTFVKEVEQVYSEDGIIFRRRGSYSGDKAIFSAKDDAENMSYTRYTNDYGALPTQLTKYVVGTPLDNSKAADSGIDFNTIISATDNNAPSSGNEPNAISEREGVDFYIPEKLVANEDGNYVFTVKLHPQKSAVYYRSEVRTRGGADQNPVFKSVTLTVTINDEWLPISVKTVESYDIAIPFLGAMGATGTLTETFSYIDDDTQEVPERDFFQPYIDAVKNDPNYVPIERPAQTEDTSSIGYLTAAFGEYLSGNKNLDLEASITSDIISVNDLTLSLGLGENITADVLLGRLYVKYADGKINIRLNDINGYMSVSDFASLTDNQNVKALLNSEALSSLRGENGELDFNSLLSKVFGDRILDTVFENCEMTDNDGIICLNFPFELDLSALGIKSENNIKINPSIYINGEGKTLNKIYAEVTVGKTVIKISAMPCQRPPVFPDTKNAADLSGLSDFAEAALETAVQKTYGISGKINALGAEIGVDAYIDRTDGLKADAALKLFGLDVSLKIIGENAYVSVGNIDIRGKLSELPDLLKPILKITGYDSKLTLLKNILPETVEGYANMLTSLEVKPDALKVGLDFFKLAEINAAVKYGNGKLTGIDFDLNVDAEIYGFKFDASGELSLSSPAQKSVAAPVGGKYLSFAEAAELLSAVEPYTAAENNLEVSIAGSAAGITLSGNINVDKTLDAGKNVTGVAAAGSLSVAGQKIDISFTDNVLYAAIGAVKVKLATDCLEKFSPAINKLTDLLSPSDGEAQNDLVKKLVEGISSVEANNGELTAYINLDGVSLTAKINAGTGKIAVNGSLGEAALDVALTVKTAQKSHGISAPADKNTYADAAEFDATLDAVADIIANKGFAAGMSLVIGEASYNAALDVVIDGGLELRLTEDTLGIDVTLKNSELYIKAGNIRLKGKISDVNAIMDALYEKTGSKAVDGLINSIRPMLSGAPDIDKLAELALGAIRSFAVSDGYISLLLSVNDGTAINVKVGTKLDSITLKISGGADGAAAPTVAASISLGGKPAAIPAPEGSFTDLGNAVTLIEPALKYISDGYTAALDGSVAGIELSGSAKLDITDGIKASALLSAFDQTALITYYGDTVYAELGNIKIKLDTNGTDGLKTAGKALIDAAGASKLPDITKLLYNGLPEILNAITSFDISNGVITLGAQIDLDGETLYAVLSIDVAAGKILISVKDGEENVYASLGANVTAGKVTVADVENKADYSDIALLEAVLNAATPIVTNEGLTATAEFGGSSFDIKLSFADGILASVYDAESGITVAAELDGKDIYATCAALGIKVSADDINPALDCIAPVLDLLGIGDTVNGLTGAVNGGIASAMGTALTAVKSLAVTEGHITVDLELSGQKISAVIATDLSEITVTVGEGSDANIIKLGGIKPASLTLTHPDKTKCAALSDVIKLASPVLSLLSDSAFCFELEAAMFGQTVTGELYLDFTSGFAAQLALNIAGVSATVTVKDGTLYINIGTENNRNNILISEPLTIEGIKTLICELDSVIPGIKATAKAAVDYFKSLTASKILDMLTFGPAQNGGFVLTAELSLEEIANAEGGLKFDSPDISLCVTYSPSSNGDDASVAIECDVFGISVSLELVPTVTACKLASLDASRFVVSDVPFDRLTLTISPTAARELNFKAGFVTVSDLVKYIKPVIDIINDADGVNLITLDLDAFALFDNNSETDVTGRAKLALIPVYGDGGKQTGTKIAVSVTLTLFDGTEDATDVTVTFIDNTVYIQSGSIRLKLDTDNDFIALYDILSNYLPEYINIELAKLFNVPDAPEGTSAFNSVALIVERLQKIIDAAASSELQGADKADAIIDLLFERMDSVAGTSFLRTVSDLVGISKTGNSITLSVSVMSIMLNITPILETATDNDGNEIRSIPRITVTTNVAGITLRLGVSNYLLNSIVKPGPNNTSLPDTALLEKEVTVPENSESYVSIIDFIQAIQNAVNTFTARTAPANGNENGDIAFELKTFMFDYDVFEPMPDYERDETGNLVFPEGSTRKSSNGGYYWVDGKGNEVKPNVKTNADGSVKYMLDSAGRTRIQPAYEKLNVSNVQYAKRDETGELVLKAGSDKEIAKHIIAKNTSNNSALKFARIGFDYTDSSGITAHKNGINIEAHIDLYISTLTRSSSEQTPLALDLYVIMNAENPDGFAFIDYYEGKSGYGERIYIDYISVMQIVAAAMDIVGADDQTVESLLGDYRLNIDTSVFDSMAIAGLDDIKVILNGFATAINDITGTEENDEGALYYIKKAWGEFHDTAKSIDDLRLLINHTDDSGKEVEGVISTYITKALEKLEHAIEAFDTSEPDKETVTGNGAELFVNGVCRAHLIQNTDTDSARLLEYRTDRQITFKKGDIITFTLDGTKLSSLVNDNNSKALAAKTGVSDYVTLGKKGDYIVSLILYKDDAAAQNYSVCLGKPNSKINGKLFNQIVNGVWFDKLTDTNDGKTTDTLMATIDNTVTTQTPGISTVTVKQTDNVIDTVAVAGLDVNTNRLNSFNAQFTAGELPEWSFNPSMLNSSGKRDYSDFGNIKHLLFDVMNTANMLEFEIGGSGKEQIKVEMNLGVVTLNMVIGLSAKVKIMDQGEGADPRYKTAADIELNIPETKAKLLAFIPVPVLPKCITRLFFYDDVLYMHGVSNWESFVGKVKNLTYCDEMFTVSEMMNILSDSGENGMNKLLSDFIFKLIPIRTDGIDIQDIIIKQMQKESPAEDSTHTVAQIFKGYSYSNGTHNLTVGLKELALDSRLGDAQIALTGANDDDGNIFDCYVSKLHLYTTLISIVKATIDADLINVSTPTRYYTDATLTVNTENNTPSEFGREELRSTGFNPTVINGTEYTLDGRSAKDGLQKASIIDSLLPALAFDGNGKIIESSPTHTSANGTVWTHIWNT